jgi:hypothetical protein
VRNLRQSSYKKQAIGWSGRVERYSSSRRYCGGNVEIAAAISKVCWEGWERRLHRFSVLSSRLAHPRGGIVDRFISALDTLASIAEVWRTKPGEFSGGRYGAQSIRNCRRVLSIASNAAQETWLHMATDHRQTEEEQRRGSRGRGCQMRKEC